MALAACSDGGGPDAASQIRVHELMADRLDPAAETIWDNAGWIITTEGEEELWPTTEEGWAEVAASADEISALAATLANDDHARYADNTEDWIEIAGGLATAAARARQAAEARDKQGLFDAGGHLYRVCVSCHERYLIGESGE